MGVEVFKGKISFKLINVSDLNKLCNRQKYFKQPLVINDS